jgi:predicted regulator of Ras-like GTPase activity (Roadblock/LC7/MglB family)
MGTLPQLLEEDIQLLDSVLNDFLERSDASTAIVIDKGGFVITSEGDSRSFDLTTIGALASGAYLANQTIANLVHESNFDSVYQQGEKFSMFAINIDEHCILVVIFQAKVGVGVVKYHAIEARVQIATQLKIAAERNPDAGLDLSVLNIADASELFKRRD